MFTTLGKLKNRSKTTYTLIKDHHISSSTIDKSQQTSRSPPRPWNDLHGSSVVWRIEILEYVPCRTIAFNQDSQKPFFKAAIFWLMVDITNSAPKFQWSEGFFILRHTCSKLMAGALLLRRRLAMDHLCGHCCQNRRHITWCHRWCTGK